MGTKKIILILILVGLLVRILFLGIGYFKGGSDYFLNYGDAKGYVNLAQNILAGRGFSLSSAPPFIPDSSRTPLYSLFLSASLFFFHSFWPAIFLQILLGALIPVIAFRLFQELNFSYVTSLAASFFLVLEPFFAASSVFLLSDVSFLFFLLISLLFYIRFTSQRKFRQAVLTGFFLGVAALFRPLAFYILPLMVIHAILTQRWQWRFFTKLLLLIIFTLATVSPWTWRNEKIFGTARLSSIDTINIYFFQAGSVLAMERGTALEVEKQKLVEDLAREKIDPRNLANTNLLRKKALAIFTSHPVAFLKISALTAWQFFTHDAYYDMAWHLGFYREKFFAPPTVLEFKKSISALPEFLSREPFFAIFILGRLFWVILFILFLIGTAASWRLKENRKRDFFIILLVLYTVAASLSTGYSVNARFRMPILPFYAIYAMLAVGIWQERRRLLKTHV